MEIDKDLAGYLTKAMEKLVADVLKGTLGNPRESKFLVKCAENQRVLKNRRQKYAAQGKHIPGFLILSITDRCNLHCKGCYARANGICEDSGSQDLLTAAQWQNIFTQGEEMGIGFMLLAGGEPLLRPDVIKAAAAVNKVVFPIFTNGTLMNKAYLSLFDKYRNLVPILSIEGDQEATDSRRGEGVTAKILKNAALLKEKKILFGVSLTVTAQNLEAVTNSDFLKNLRDKGCRAVLFIEYVAVDPATANKELTPTDQAKLRTTQAKLKGDFPTMVFISFPGDEEQMGGCLAGGRGFFHVNPQGGVEACPFSPYGDRDLKEVTLAEALDSPFFARLRKEKLVGGEHNGGCALFQQETAVKKCLENPEEN